MKNIWLLTVSNIKRNKFTFFMAVIGAGLLCIILYFIGGMVGNATVANTGVGVIDYDHSILSEDFKDYLKKDLSYDLKEDYTYTEFSEMLINKDISVIIEIPEGFYDKFAIGEKENIIITPLDDFENTAYVQTYINNYMGSISLLSQGAGGNKDCFDQMLSDYKLKSITVSRSTAADFDVDAMKSRTGFMNSIGFFLMFVFSISIMVSYMVFDDRQSGVYNRIQITPVKPIQYIVGSGIFGVLLCLLQLVLYIGYIILSDIDTGIPLYEIILLMCLFSVFTVCFSLAIAVILKSRNSITTFSIGFATIGCILGGAYFPIDMAPKTLQNLARVLPQYWFMDALRNIQENVTANILPNITILVLFSVLSMLIGAVLFAQNYKNN